MTPAPPPASIPPAQPPASAPPPAPPTSATAPPPASLPTIDARTRLAAVIGAPVRHSLSPALHNAGFAALGLPWAYVAFEVAEGRAAEALAAVRVLGIEGLSVTMPHKSDVARAVDALSPTAQRLGAVNCVRRRGDELVGENTDGEGFLRSLRQDAGFDPAGRRCLVVGAGGAARAVVVALAGAGAAEVAVANRSTRRAVEAAALAGPVGRTAGAEEADRFELVVNATPVGMAAPTGSGSPAPPVDPDRLGAGQVVADLIYHPLCTTLLEVAQSRGAATVNGLGMLLHQAGLAFELWTGHEPPLDAMREAALRQLARPDEARSH